jgi:small subunit ribosomal protein S6
MKTYEGMFLLDAGHSDFEAVAEPVRQVLTRIGADVLNLKPWDERRLAYTIKGRKRGLYVLTYFKAEPGRLDELQHEIHLSEPILRAMVLSADHVSEEQINAETPATLQRARRAAAEARKAEAAPVEIDDETAARIVSEAPAEGGDGQAPPAGKKTAPAGTPRGRSQ